jgi:hypothetical protein
MIIDVSITIQRSRDCQNVWSKSEKRVLFFAKQDSNPKILGRQRNDGGRSSMVEPQIVVLVVAGSSPVGHPFQNVKLLKRVTSLQREASLHF